MKKLLTILPLLVLVLALVLQAHSPQESGAVGTLTLPFRNTGVGVNSWFDHTSPAVGQTLFDNDPYTMTRYDGATDWWIEYNGHAGIDFALPSDSGVIAAEDGVVTFVGWESPDPDVGFGFYVRVWHATSGITTLYGHLTDSTVLVSQNDSVQRGQLIGVSDDTGYSTGPHLHFGGYSGQSWTPIDPYGWSGGGLDPWEPDRDYGYLWTTNPPSIGPCITPTAPYRDDSLYREEPIPPGNGQVFVVRGQTKYYIPNEQTFVAMGFDWGAIQCANYGSLAQISNVPYDKTLFIEWSEQPGQPIYLADCQAKFWVPNMDVLNYMVANGWANYPPYVIPPGNAVLISDVPFNGCRMQEYGIAMLWLTCPNASRKSYMTPYAWSIFSQIDSTVRIVWPSGQGYTGPLDTMTTLGQTQLRLCPDYDYDEWDQHFSDLAEQYMGTDPAHRCAATTTVNDEGPPDRWPFDFNDDRAASILDVGTFSSRFGSTAPGPPYDRRWDLNSDDRITVLDTSMYSAVFGKGCTPWP